MTENASGSALFPRSTWLSLLAETSLHPGAGRELGVVDLPVAREGGTGYPLLFGSQLKGSLRDRAEQAKLPDLVTLFGAPEEGAGDLLFSDARLVLLPVRSLTSSYRWLTSPHLLERLRRDLKRTKTQITFAPIDKLGERQARSNKPSAGKIFLEEREVEVAGPLPPDAVAALESLLAQCPEAAGRVGDYLTIVDDDTFSWFARYGLPVRARNKLGDRKKSESLWYVESLPPDTLLVATVTHRKGADPDEDLENLFGANPYLQVGGHETVGEGWVAVSWEGK